MFGISCFSIIIMNMYAMHTLKNILSVNIYKRIVVQLLQQISGTNQQNNYPKHFNVIIFSKI